MMSPILSSLSKQLERPEAERLVEDLVDQPLALVAVQQRVFGVAELLDDASDLVAQRLGVDLGDAVHVEPVDEPHVDMPLEGSRTAPGPGRPPWAALPCAVAAEAEGGELGGRRRSKRPTLLSAGGSASRRVGQTIRRAHVGQTGCVPVLATSVSTPLKACRAGASFKRMRRTRFLRGFDDRLAAAGPTSPGDLQENLVRPAAVGDVSERNPFDPRLLERLGGELGICHEIGIFRISSAFLRLISDSSEPARLTTSLTRSASPSNSRKSASSRAVFRRQIKSSWTTTRITSDISNAAKSDDCSPLLVSITTVWNAARKRPKSRLQVLRVDRGGFLDLASGWGST